MISVCILSESRSYPSVFVSQRHDQPKQNLSFLPINGEEEKIRTHDPESKVYVMRSDKYPVGSKQFSQPMNDQLKLASLDKYQMVPGPSQVKNNKTVESSHPHVTLS